MEIKLQRSYESRGLKLEYPLKWKSLIAQDQVHKLDDIQHIDDTVTT